MKAGQEFDARPRWRRPLVAAGLVLAVACATAWQTPREGRNHRTEPVAGAGASIGAEECTDCHASFEGHFAAGERHADCESCHGPAQLHAHTARAGDIAFPGNDDCATCHETGSKTLLGWSTSTHARTGVLCSDCHDTHNREPWHLRDAGQNARTTLPRATASTRLCASCHPEVEAQLALPSHHPVGEGMLDCTDCHGAHEDRAASRSRQTDVCTECHQEVAGPWIHEHAPVNEDCGYCHTPHGASADFLLQVNQPGTCISCHSVATAGAIHDPYAFTTRCTDCHAAIHGSYTDPVLRR